MYSVYSAAITVAIVMNPIGNAPIFMGILGKAKPRQQVHTIFREVGIAFLVLTAFLMFGQYIMHFLHITTPAITLGGGVVLFLIALDMLFPREKDALAGHSGSDPLLVPLAVPLTAGPSSMAVIMLVAAHNPHHTFENWLSLVIATAAYLAIMLFSVLLDRIISQKVMLGLERFMGMILTIIAIQMLLSGVTEYMHALAK